MTDIPDHYAALGIDPTADPEVIAAAYRALAKKFHPDTGTTTGTACAVRFAEIQHAYDVLGNPEGRKRYDLDLLQATQRELDEHLARKQRKIAGSTAAPPPPPPDLGNIRPERPGPRPGGFTTAAKQRGAMPFFVVLGLLMAVVGDFAGLYLRQAPAPVAEQPAAPPPIATKLPPPAAVPPRPPLFGTSLMDEPAPQAQQAAAIDPPAPAPVPKTKPPEAPAIKASPVETLASTSRFSVVIYEKYRSGDIIRETGSILFTSQSRCNDFGEQTVLRRLAPFEGQRNRPRIWYECRAEP
jgi:hypothetical protein